jgi:hypothetical protein
VQTLASKEEDKIEETRKNIESIKNNIYQKQEHVQAQISTQMMNRNMQEARAGLDSKRTFVGALDFLNSQASLSMVNKKSKGFDAIA